ncbi:hypothetical protein [Niallia nealsonii]|uniref:Uncharacterized protein n=1 Tax=Niallia nealsonii TaxID=115979 RepID=A0A2N0Z1B3_9BACI|nr:hypothetical protein [Niallia nealsonii]PKG23295.1 hypothetical protein CWS01_12660 [Niallia nealsonii]
MLLFLSFVYIWINAKTDTVSVEINTYTKQEESKMLTLTYNALDPSLQNKIADQKQGSISGFKSGSKFLVKQVNSSQKKDIKNRSTIKISYLAKEPLKK